MSIRSPPLFGLALACLLSSAALGALLYHDGEVGAAGALDARALGDDVRVKGMLRELSEPVGPAAAHLQEYTMVLELEGQPDLLFLLTSDEPLPQDGVALAEGELVDAGLLRQRTYMVLDAADVWQPLVFA